jgi:hypothetical protein
MSGEQARQGVAAEVDAAVSALPDDPAAAEHLAATYAFAFERPGSEAGTAALLVDALVERGDARALRVLGLLAELGAEEVAAPAAGARAALLARGVAEEPDGLADAHVAQAWIEPETKAVVLWLRLERAPGTSQLAWFVLRRLAGAEIVAAGELRAPAGDEVVARALAAGPQDTPPQPVTPDAALDRLLAAAAATAAAGRAVDPALGAALIVVAHRSGRPRPALELDLAADGPPPLVLGIRPGDEDAMYSAMDDLLDDFTPFVRSRFGADSAQWRVGDLVGGAMIEYRGRADGRLTHWTVPDLRAFLLEWFPRKVLADRAILRDVPAAMLAFLEFLADRGLLEGDPPEALALAAAELAEPFLELVRGSGETRRSA